MSLQNNVNLQSSQRYKSTFQQLQNNVKALYFSFLEQRCYYFSNVNKSLQNNIDLRFFLRYNSKCPIKLKCVVATLICNIEKTVSQHYFVDSY